MSNCDIIKSQRIVIPNSSVSYKLMGYERLFVLMASFMPLDGYNIQFGLGWTVDRVLLIVLILFFPLYFSKRRISWGIAPLIVCFGIISLVLSVMTGGITKGVVRYLPSLLQSYVVLGVGAYVFKDNPRAFKIINYIFISWAIILLVFTAYMFFFYYVLNITFVPSPFGGEYTGLEHKLGMMKSRRFFLPFASSPHLGAIAGFIGLWAMIIFLKTRRWLMLVLGIIMLNILVLSLSRGPVLSFILVFFLFVGMGCALKVVKINKQLFGIALAFVIIISAIGSYHGLQTETVGKASVDRLAIANEDMSQSRHLEMRLHALELFEHGTLFQLFCGQGLGAFEASGVGAYSFASYLTFLVETGILGAFVFVTIVGWPLLLCGWKALFSSGNKRFWFLFIFTMALYIALVHLFYEQKTLPCLWLSTSFVFGLSQGRSQHLHTAGLWLNLSNKQRIRQRWVNVFKCYSS